MLSCSKKYFFMVVGALFFCLHEEVFSQRSGYCETFLRQGKQSFDNGHFGSAKHYFEKASEELSDGSKTQNHLLLKAEIDYYLLFCDVKESIRKGIDKPEELLSQTDNFASKYGKGPAEKIYRELGNHLLEAGDKGKNYRFAQTFFLRITEKKVPRNEQKAEDMARLVYLFSHNAETKLINEYADLLIRSKAAGPFHKASAHYGKAFYFYDMKKYGAAAQNAEIATKHLKKSGNTGQPLKQKVHGILVMSYVLEGGKNDKAVEAFEEAEENGLEFSPAVKRMMAVIYHRAGLYSRTLDLFKGISEESLSMNENMCLANALMQDCETESCADAAVSRLEAAYLRFSKTAPDKRRPEDYFHIKAELGTAYFRKGSYVKANEHFSDVASEKSQKASGFRESAFFWNIISNYRLGNHKRTYSLARNYLEEFGNSNPENFRQVEALSAKIMSGNKFSGKGVIMEMESAGFKTNNMKRVYQHKTLKFAIDLLRQRKPEKAIIYLEKSMAQPQDQELLQYAYFHRANAALLLGDTENAYTFLKKIKTSDNDLRAKKLRAASNVLYRMERYEKAAELAQRFIKMRPKDPKVKESLALIGDSYYHLSKLSKAFQFYERSLLYNTDIKLQAELKYKQALISAYLDNYEESNKLLRQVISFEGNALRNMAHKKLIENYFVQGQTRKAALALEDLIDLDSDDPTAVDPNLLAHRAEAHKDIGDHKKMVRDYSYLVQYFPTEQETKAAYKELTEYHHKTASVPNYAYLRRIYEGANPEDETLIATKFNAIKDRCLSKGDVSDCIGEYEQLAEMYPESQYAANAYCEIGWIYNDPESEFTDRNKAAEYFGKVSPLHKKKYGDAQEQLAMIYKAQEKSDKRLQALQKTYDIYRSEGVDQLFMNELHVRLSEAYFETGDYRQALAMTSRELPEEKRYRHRAKLIEAASHLSLSDKNNGRWIGQLNRLMSATEDTELFMKSGKALMAYFHKYIREGSHDAPEHSFANMENIFAQTEERGGGTNSRDYPYLLHYLYDSAKTLNNSERMSYYSDKIKIYNSLGADKKALNRRVYLEVKSGHKN